MLSQPKIVHLAAGDGRSFLALSDLVTFKLTGHQTAEKFALFELIVPPADGPPVRHKHAWQETFYVLEGAFEFSGQGDDGVSYAVQATAGAMLHVPGSVPHGYQNVGAASGRLLVISSPSGLELFYAELGVPVADAVQPATTLPDMARVMAIGLKYRIEFL
ncbi:MAG: cupin [Anaerolineaceae bacterium]|nr:cupin [Anaerolineaceae bacterium]